MFYLQLDSTNYKILGVGDINYNDLVSDKTAIIGFLSIPINEDKIEFCESHPYLTSGAWYYRDNQIVCDEKELATILHEKQATKIRQQRETECFPIINRGQMWYMMRTPEQLQELQTWYQAWLDAPETLTIPDKPTWLE